MKKKCARKTEAHAFLCIVASVIIIHACFYPLCAGNRPSCLAPRLSRPVFADNRPSAFGSTTTMALQPNGRDTDTNEYYYDESTTPMHTAQRWAQEERKAEHKLAEQFFHAIATKDATEITRLAHTISPNVKNLTGQTPLMEAIQTGYLEGVQVLLNARGIDVNAFGGGTRTALMLAAEKGDLEIVKALLSVNGIDVQKSIANHTALLLAVQKGHVNVARALLTAIYPKNQQFVQSFLARLFTANPVTTTRLPSNAREDTQNPA